MPDEFDMSAMSLDDLEPIIDRIDPYDPAEPPNLMLSKKEPLPEKLSPDDIGFVQPEIPEKMTLEEFYEQNQYLTPIDKYVDITYKAAKKSFWKTLGILYWPFVRIEAGLATPATALMKDLGPTLKAATANYLKNPNNFAYSYNSTPPTLFYTPDQQKTYYKNEVRKMLTDETKRALGKNFEPMLEEFAERQIAAEDVPVPEFNEFPGAFLTGMKSFVPFTRNDPEKVKSFNDFWGAYYEEMTGEPAPEAYKQAAGISTSYLVTPLVLGKILKLAKTGVTKIPIVQKILSRKIPEWQAAKLRRRAEIFQRNERAAKLGKTLADKEAKRLAHQLSVQTGKQITPEAVKLRLGQIIKGSITEQEMFASRANPVIDELQANFKTLQKLNILGQDTYLTKLTKNQIVALNTEKQKLLNSLNRLETAPHYVGTSEISARFPGRAKQISELRSQVDAIDDRLWQSKLIGGQLYSPRMYTTKEAKAAERVFPAKGGPKIKAPYAKARQDIPQEARRQMGEILEPAYPVTKRLIQEAQDIETGKLFQFVASKGEWVDDIWREGLSKTPLPATKTYGPLAGKYVNQSIYNDIQEMTRIRSNIESLYDSVIGSWKMGKTVLNPATHFRNVASNTILLDLSGMDHVAQTKYLTKAIREIGKQSDEFQTARKYFGRTSMVSGELLDDMLKTMQADKSKGIQKGINIWNHYFSKATGAPANIYQNEEFLFKFMKYLEQREKGMSVMKSVTEANKWLFDYGDLSAFEKTYMRRIAPFYTFPRKALPRVLESAAERPLTIAKYPIMAWAMEKYSLSQLNMTDEDYEKLQSVLPEYMENGSYILMPFRDQNGDLRFYDWTYVVPWGELYDAQDRGLLGSMVTNPVLQTWADITRNRSGFSNREIYKETDTEKEKNFKKMVHVWQTAMPSLMYKGIYWDKLYNAATGKPSKMGEITPIAPTIAHTVFGLRTQPIDAEKQARFRISEKVKEIEELEKKISDIVIREQNGNIDEEEFTRKRAQYLGQIETILDEIGQMEVPESELNRENQK